MASRRAITKAQAVRYRSASRAGKSEILNLVCAVTRFNRDYARRALKQALRSRVVKPRTARPPKYDAKVVAALQKCWAVVNAPAGKRLAPILAEVVPLLRGHGELDIDDDTAVLLIAVSAATIDRRLAHAPSTLVLKGRSHTKPGSLLKSRIPMRTWADHDENCPGFVEIDLVGQEGGNSRGEFCFILTVNDIAPVVDLGPRQGALGPRGLPGRDRHPGLLRRPSQPVAARHEREHQRAAAPVLPQGHRPLAMERRGDPGRRQRPQPPTPQDPLLAHPRRSPRRAPTITPTSRCCDDRLNPP